MEPCQAHTYLDSGADDQQVVDRLYKDVRLGGGQPHCNNRLLLATILNGHIVPVARSMCFSCTSYVVAGCVPSVKAPEEECVVNRRPGAAQLGKDAAETDRLAGVVAVEDELRHLVEHGHARAQQGWPLWRRVCAHLVARPHIHLPLHAEKSIASRARHC